LQYIERSPNLQRYYENYARDGGREAVTIQRVGGGKDTSDYSRHTHDNQESFRYKRPELLWSIARVEREKNYLSAQVYSALRGVGTTEGSNRFELAGGASINQVLVIYYFMVIMLNFCD